MNVFLKDLTNLDYEAKIESRGIIKRLFLIGLIPIKYLITFLLLMIILVWAFSGFGFMLVAANLADYGEVGVLGWIVIAVDSAIIIRLVLEKLYEE
jgi:hypothetical protein